MVSKIRLSQIDINASPISLSGYQKSAEVISKYGYPNEYEYPIDLFDKTEVDGGTVSHDNTSSSVNLEVGTISTSNARSTSRIYNRYTLGSDQEYDFSVYIENLDDNAVFDFGNFDYERENGIFFRIKNVASVPTLHVVLRRTVFGNPTQEFEIPQSSFSEDKLDGTGPSGFNIDLTKGNLFYLTFLWLGVGPAELGIKTSEGVIAAHIFKNENSFVGPYMRTANLPFNFDLYNTSAASSSSSVRYICSSLKSISGYDYINEPGYARSAYSGPKNITSTVNFLPLVSIRLAQLYNGIPNRSIVVVDKVSATATTNDAFELVLIKNGTLGSPTSFSAISAKSCCEEDNSSTSITGGDIIFRENVGRSSGSIKSPGRYSILTRNAANTDSDIITLAARKISSNATVVGSIDISEKR